MSPKDHDRNLSNLTALYRERFDERGLEQKDKVWKTICESYLQRFVEPSDAVLDIGAGTCEFINNIKCATKYAADINPHMKEYAAEGVEIIPPKDTEMLAIEDSSVNVVFASNFFEHLSDRQRILDTLAAIRRTLVTGGRLIVVQPNVKYLTMDYWDYFDHQIAISHKSMREALVTTGFDIEILRARFLPYTFRSRFPKGKIFVKTYLRFQIIQRIFGKQMLIVARKQG